LLLYTQALYETGNYGKHVVMCDHLLEQIIMHNIESWGGEDVYLRILFQKAASLANLHEFTKAEHVLRELLKLHPRQEQARRLLMHALLEQKPEWLQKVRAVAVGLTLLAALAIAIEIFVIKPFFPWYFDLALLVHNLLLGGGILTFAIGEWRHYGICRKRSYGFADAVYKQKTQRRC
jgi:hypothetical protein